MASIFSKLPNDLIINIIQIDNDRRKREKERILYEEVIYQLSRFNWTFKDASRRQLLTIIKYALCRKYPEYTKLIFRLSKPKIEKLLDWELFTNSNRLRLKQFEFIGYPPYNVEQQY